MLKFVTLINKIKQSMPMYSDDSLIQAPIVRKSRYGKDKKSRNWFGVGTNGRFNNPENSLIQKYRLGTNVSGLTNRHCNVI